jgi:hypothetical protein
MLTLYVFLHFGIYYILILALYYVMATTIFISIHVIPRFLLVLLLFLSLLCWLPFALPFRLSPSLPRLHVAIR